SRRVNVSLPSFAEASEILQCDDAATDPSALSVAELTSRSTPRPARMVAAIVYCPSAPGWTESPCNGIVPVSDGLGAGFGAGAAPGAPPAGGGEVFGGGFFAASAAAAAACGLFLPHSSSSG